MKSRIGAPNLRNNAARIKNRKPRARIEVAMKVASGMLVTPDMIVITL